MPQNKHINTMPDTDAFFTAADAGDVKTIASFIKNGFDVNLRRQNDENSPTALMLASERGHKDIVKILLAAKADPNLTSADFKMVDDGTEALPDGGHAHLIRPQIFYGATALMRALKFGQEEVSALLLTAGANPDMQDSDGNFALIIAAKAGYKETVNLLLKAKANPNLQDLGGSTALMEASYTGYDTHEEIVKTLITAKANVNMQDARGNTALMMAVERENKPIVERLLAAGANPDTQNLEGKSALMKVPQTGYYIAQLLLKAKADINLKDSNGFTALMYAAQNGSPSVVTLFLKAGADHGARAKDGTTALILAEKAGYAEAADILRNIK